MPVIDSRHRIIFEDPKPERVCQWYACPLAASGYIGRKMKQCVKCTFVRYCVSVVLLMLLFLSLKSLQSKDCQRHDWQSHKRYCKIPPIMDLGEWMEVNEPCELPMTKLMSISTRKMSGFSNGHLWKPLMFTTTGQRSTTTVFWWK